MTHLIWTMATKKLNLERQIIRGASGGDDVHRLQFLRRERAVPADESGYMALAKAYNQMIDAHERLEADSSLLYTHTFDPSCTRDSAHLITQSACGWLLDEIYIVGRLLKESEQMMPKSPFIQD